MSHLAGSRPARAPRSTPSRRAVVAGSAWAAPLVVVGSAAPAFAASPCQTQYSYRLDWGTSAFNRVSATSASVRVTSSNGGPDIFVTFAVAIQGANVPDTTRNLTVPGPTAGSDANLDPAITNLGGLGNGELGLRLQNATSPAGRANRQELTVTFHVGSVAGAATTVSSLNFYVTDIDAITTSPYADRVELSGTYAQTRDAAIAGTGFFDPTSPDPWRNTNTNINVNENSAGARVNVIYPTAKSFLLAYWNNSAPGTQYHRIFLSDFVFTANGCS